MQLNQLAGQLLLATPSLKDPNFRDAVVLVCNHDTDGSMGLIINRPRDITVLNVIADLDIQAADKMQDISSLSMSVFEGGPIDEFRGFVLHDGWNVFDSTMQVTPELYLTASRDVLEELGKGEGPEHYMMMLGYAGWASGQLEEELANNDWLIAPASHQIVFQEPPGQRWDFGARCMGFERSHLSNQIGHA